MEMASNKQKSYGERGFTIVELLIVIVVIGILAAISIVAYNSISNKANASRSVSDLSNINKAIMLYHAEHGSYPVTGAAWRNSNDNPTDYVPGLAPEFIGSLPKPLFSGAGPTEFYMYYSNNGQDYKIMAHGGRYQNLCPIVKAQDAKMVPSRDCWAYGYYSPGGRLY